MRRGMDQRKIGAAVAVGRGIAKYAPESHERELAFARLAAAFEHRCKGSIARLRSIGRKKCSACAGFGYRWARIRPRKRHVTAADLTRRPCARCGGRGVV